MLRADIRSFGKQRLERIDHGHDACLDLIVGSGMADGHVAIEIPLDPQHGTLIFLRWSFPFIGWNNRFNRKFLEFSLSLHFENQFLAGIVFYHLTEGTRMINRHTIHFLDDIIGLHPCQSRRAVFFNIGHQWCLERRDLNLT